MPNLPDGGAGATFDDVLRLEKSERVLGGADDSPANRHALKLARRTRYVLNRLNGLVEQAVWTTTVIAATSSTAYTVPANVVSALLTGVAAGGGGAYGDVGVGPGPGGGEGARIQDYPITLTPAAVMAATIGAAGVGGTSGTPIGSDGGNCTFAGITLGGGKGGDQSSGNGGLGGTVTLGGITYRGDPGSFEHQRVDHGGRGGGTGGGRDLFGAAGEDGVDGGGGAGGAANAASHDGGAGGPGYFILKVLTLNPDFTA